MLRVRVEYQVLQPGMQASKVRHSVDLTASKAEVRVANADLQTEVTNLRSDGVGLRADVVHLQAETKEEQALLNTVALQVNKLTPVSGL